MLNLDNMTLAQALFHFINNSPRRIEGMEKDAWSGIEGDGWIADVGEESCVVVDILPDHLHIEVYNHDDGGRFWHMDGTALGKELF